MKLDPLMENTNARRHAQAAADRHYVAGLEGVRAHTRALSTGTLVILVAPGVEESDPDAKWMLVCDPHGGCCGWPTRREALTFLSHPEEWCPTCQEARS